MKALIFIPLLFALAVCSKSAPVNEAKPVQVTGSDKDIKEQSQSIDDAADEAAAIVETEANEEITAYEGAEADVETESEPAEEQ
jgi:hypothetical protein